MAVSGFSSRVHGLTSCRQLAGFTEPVMNSLLWYKPLIQLHGGCLASRYKYRCCTFGGILLQWSMLWSIDFTAVRTTNCFSPLVACIATPDMVRESPQGGGFQVSPTSVWPMSEEWDVISKSFLLSSSERQWRVIAVAYSDLCVSSTLLTVSLREFCMPGTMFFGR